MGDRHSYRTARLDALRAKVSARAAAAQVEKNQALDELVDLLREIDPIPRQKYWPAWAIRKMAREQEGKCWHCRHPLPALHEGAVHVHHVIPWALGGGNDNKNVKVLHDTCNLKLGRRCNDDDLIDYLWRRVSNL